MADHKVPQPQHPHETTPNSPKPETAAKPGKHADGARDQERMNRDKHHQDNSRGDRNSGNVDPSKGGRR